MFDRCRRWHKLLNARAEQGLAPAESDALHAHLARCEACRKRARADDDLHFALTTHTGLLDAENARLLDDRIVSAVQNFPAPAPRVVWNWKRRISQPLPFPFLSQLLGGGLVAAALTVVSLFSTLHPAQTPAPHDAGKVIAAPSAPPLPLEALLDSPSPRAALLWRTSGKNRPSAPRRMETVKPVPLRALPGKKADGAALECTVPTA